VNGVNPEISDLISECKLLFKDVSAKIRQQTLYNMKSNSKSFRISFFVENIYKSIEVGVDHSTSVK
jgi:hypothetical protein